MTTKRRMALAKASKEKLISLLARAERRADMAQKSLLTLSRKLTSILRCVADGERRRGRR